MERLRLERRMLGWGWQFWDRQPYSEGLERAMNERYRGGGPINSTESLLLLLAVWKKNLHHHTSLEAVLKLLQKKLLLRGAKLGQTTSDRCCMWLTTCFRNSVRTEDEQWVKQMWLILPVSQWTESFVEPRDKGRGHSMWRYIHTIISQFLNVLPPS